MQAALNEHPQTSQFYMVWSPTGDAPTRMHRWLHEAQREAERLANAHKGRLFYVLCAEEYRMVEAPMKSVKLDREVPF